MVKVQSKEGAMRKTLFFIFAIALIGAATVEVVAAPRRSIAVERHYYASPVGEIHVVVPNGLKGFSADLIPQ